jgi:hypothetical protein
VRQLPSFSKRQWFGFVCIYLAGLGWLSDIIIPFTRLPHKPILFAVALGFAEVMFFTGVALLGRTTYDQAKAALLRQISGRNHKP